jgi:lysophospholipase L1-like esterase
MFESQRHRVAVEMLLLALVLPAGAQTIATTTPAPKPAASAAADFAYLAHYRAANAELPPLSAKNHRVVFLGDSITEYWGHKAGTWFAQPQWLNRGITGQTTSQILLRVQQDVIALHPEAIVMEGGSNDMRYGFTPEAIRDNMASIGEIAEANHIKVFLALMTPTCDCYTAVSGARTPERIRQLNALYEQLCREHGWVCMDYYTPLADPNGLMRKELTLEGVHPDDAGYALLAPVVLEKLKAYR